MIPVDLFGQMAALERVEKAAPDIPLIEDAAQSIGAGRTIGGKSVMAGERATIGTLSFFPSKNLGAYGDGGMMLTQDETARDASQAPARSRRREDLLPRRGRLQQPSRRPPGGRTAGEAATPRGLERQAA